MHNEYNLSKDEKVELNNLINSVTALLKLAKPEGLDEGLTIDVGMEDGFYKLYKYQDELIDVACKKKKVKREELIPFLEEYLGQPILSLIN